jgi:hypothetical protein
MSYVMLSRECRRSCHRLRRGVASTIRGHCCIRRASGYSTIRTVNKKKSSHLGIRNRIEHFNKSVVIGIIGIFSRRQDDIHEPSHENMKYRAICPSLLTCWLARRSENPGECHPIRSAGRLAHVGACPNGLKHRECSSLRHGCTNITQSAGHILH